MGKQTGMSIQILSEGQRIERASELAEEKARVKIEVSKLMQSFPRYEPDRTMFIRNLVNKALSGKVSEAAFKEFAVKTGSWNDIARILPRAKTTQRNPLSKEQAIEKYVNLERKLDTASDKTGKKIEYELSKLEAVYGVTTQDALEFRKLERLKKSKNPISISESDANWFKSVMHKFGMTKVIFRTSDSKKKYPDIWIILLDPPVITVTQEWAKQDTDERRKRLTHEALHFTGLEHGIIDDMDYNTFPDKDEYSKWVYQKIK